MRADRSNIVETVLDKPRSLGDLDSRVALFGHPIHAMLVAFPIAGAFWVAASDAAYWWTLDPFFARSALWGAGAAFLMGCAAALSGFGEMMLVPGARRRAAAWTHGVIAMTLLAVLALNWAHRIEDFEAAVLPWGLALSGLQLLLVGFAGWHGGKLVFEHRFGVASPEEDGDEKAGGGDLAHTP
ncbi:hypothetical protein GCM10011322_11220 [Salinarimonas ramus]|uniref:DUF2231 domain-containing protein n=2 Tax=Salinarimonas ramus TaxID=690164 RepID=A0A917Q5X7_9HYPH|nr:hypothetical protein GCM10011322_11220 [Salinarimonas ramus]